MINVSPQELDIIKEIISSEPYDFAVFGSRVKGTHHQNSDIDIVIYSIEPLPILYIENLLEKFSESDLPYRVDIVDYYRVDKNFQEIINRTKQELYL